MRRSVVMPFVLVLILSLIGGAVAPAEVGAGARSVDAWVTVKSVRPSVGCVVPIAVEVREAGAPVGGVDILAGLVSGGTVYASQRAATAADGIGYIDLELGSTPPGVARLEVSLAGSYLGHVDVTVDTGGSCESGTSVLSGALTIWWTGPSTAAAAPAGSGPVPASGASASIAVPNYVQQRNLSCEYAALQIATGAFGPGVSEYSFDAVVGLDANPHYGYRGSITGWWGNTTDYGVYAEPLAAALPRFGFYGETFYGQGDSAALTSRLDAGLPTLVWLGFWGDTGFYETGADGNTFLLVPGAHVVVAYGYDAAGVYLSDPALGTNRFFEWSKFMAMWNVFDGMALAVSPA